MAGGDPDLVAKVEPLLSAIAKRVVRVGERGAGAACKLAVNALVQKPAADQGEFLIRRLADKHPQVRTAVLAALGEGGHCERPEFFVEQFEQDDSYVAQAEALRSLGRCDAIGAVELLRKAAESDSPREIIRRAAEWALQEIQSRDQPPP